MEINCYFLIGFLIAGLFAYQARWPTLLIACLYWLITLLWAIGIVEPFSFSSAQWVSLLNINFSYNIDGLSQLFASLIAGIGIIVFIYAWFYTSETQRNRKKLLSLLQLFAISMLGIVLANDMMMLFLCWELTSITSYLLIQFDVHDKVANQAAFNSLFVSLLGGLLLLVGFISLAHVSGSWILSDSIANLPHKNSTQLNIIFLLVLCGVITKSAQFPFYFWLPGAMKAPTPVSAYLHSATMVNAGIYLLARFHPLFSPLDLWYSVLSIFGLTTMVISSILSLLQDDLKSVLAYTTIFALGVMVYLLGGKDVLPIEAFLIFLLFHAIYKAGAFMLIGIIDKEYHTRQLSELTGIARNRMFLAFAIIVIFGSMAGIPPFFGFTIKEIIYEAKLASPSISFFLMGLSILSSVLIASASFRCLWFLFKPNKTQNHRKRKKVTMIFICPVFLVGLILLFNIFDHYIKLLIEPAIQAIIPTKQLATLTPNTAISFLLGVATSIGGIICFSIFLLINKPSLQWLKCLELKSIFEKTFSCALMGGKKLTTLTQDQPFHNQLRIFFGGIIITLLMVQHELSFTNTHFDISLIDMIVCCLLLLSSLSLLLSRKFLNNLISLSLISFSISAFFIMHGAVDVTITLLLVEVLTIIIFLMSLNSAQTTAALESPCDNAINGIISLVFGFFVTFLLLSLGTTEFNNILQTFYAKNSLTVAQGKNIVNVILVDFRSLDTFGEAMVIVATAIGVISLIKKYSISKRRGNDSYH